MWFLIMSVCLYVLIRYDSSRSKTMAPISFGRVQSLRGVKSVGFRTSRRQKNQFGQFQTIVCKAPNSSLGKEKLEFGQRKTRYAIDGWNGFRYG